MENKNQGNSSAGDEGKSYEKSLEENRQRIISGEGKPVGAGLNPGNELKQGEKEKLITPVKSIAGGAAAGNDNTAEKENSADGISGGSKPRIETTLPPKELLNEREAEFNKSGPKVETGEVENKGMKERMASFQNKKSQKPMILGLILGLLIIVILAGLYLFGGGIFKKDDPQEIIKSSLEAMNEVESYSFEGDFNLDFVGDQDEEESFSLAMKFDGQADESDANNIKSSFNIKPEMAISQRGGSEEISFDSSIRSFGKAGEEMTYFKLNDFDLGAAGMMYGEIIIPHKNKWYFSDMKELQEKSDSSFRGDDFNEVMERIKELSRKYEMVKFQKDLGDEKLGDVNVYHYQVGIDSEATLDFCVELLEVTAPIIASDKLAINDMKGFKTGLEENKEEILAAMDEVLASVKTEIWIGKKDKMIYKMAISGKFDQEFPDRLAEKIKEIEGSDLAYKGDNDFGELSFDMTITMSNFNQPVEITKPEEAEDLIKVLEEAMGGFMGGTTGNHFPVENDDSDQDGLTDVMEDFYKTDKNNPDTDGDGYLDGDEVDNGYDPLAPGSAKLDYEKMFE